MGMVFSLLDDEEKIINNYPTKQEEKVNETRIYTYDSLNRMVTSKKTDNISQTVSNASYTYDKVGNCTKTVEAGVTTYSTYNSLNQLVQRDVSKNGARVGLTFYSYDANGNQVLEQTMVSPPTITETIEKEYDSNNRLTKVTCREGNAGGPVKYTQENAYNYDGQRISKTDNGVITNYYYQGGVLLYTTDEDGNKTSQNIIGPQENVIATIRYEDDGQHAYFYNKDIRTSVTNVVDESGNGVVSYKYDDYGTTTKYGDEDFYNEVCYTSGVYDQLTGLYYLNARYYNPSMAMFITQDSYRGEQKDYGTWNLYAYCGGNPINYVDPSGHKAKKSLKKVTGPRKDKRHGADKRKPSGSRERNVGHVNGEEHSRVPKGSNGRAKRTVKNVAKAGVAIGAGYVIYRGIRLLPSLLPPLWWTIPGNVAVP